MQVRIAISRILAVVALRFEMAMVCKALSGTIYHWDFHSALGKADAPRSPSRGPRVRSVVRELGSSCCHQEFECCKSRSHVPQLRPRAARYTNIFKRIEQINCILIFTVIKRLGAEMHSWEKPHSTFHYLKNKRRHTAFGRKKNKAIFSIWRRKWQPTPVFLPGASHGQRSLASYGPWGRKESDRTEQLTHFLH